MKRIALSLLLVLSLASGLCFVGCETESGNENSVRITPAAAVILLNQTIELIATGGFEYDWTLAQEDWGTLSTRQGNRVLYTSKHDPGADAFTAQQVITVTSTLNSAGGESNAVAYVKTAEAIITHQTVNTVVAIDPPNASVEKFESATFTASGANIYNWSLQFENWGSLTAREGPTTTYTSLRSADSDEDLQILTCTTDRGTTTAHILHEPEGITLTPTTAALNLNDSVKFTVSGVASANWSRSGSGAGYTSLSATTGSESILTYDNSLPLFSGSRSVTVTAI